jgi:hypothetical protein
MARQVIAQVAALLLGVSWFNHGALAAVEVEGRGEVPYELGMFSSAPAPETRQKAVAEAEKSALNRFASNYSAAKYALFRKLAPQVFSQIDQYVIDAIVVDEGARPDAKVYYAIVRAAINDAKLDALLNAQGISNAQATGGNGTAISFLFVARETDSVKEFDTRRTAIVNAQVAVTANQNQSVSGGKAQVGETAEGTKTVTTGGSSLRKADEVSYRVTSPENMNAAMNDVFSTKGIEVYDYRDVVSQCGGVDEQKIYAEFAKSDELSRETRNSAFAAARQCSINDFAVGTMDIGLQDIDPVTGNKRVYASVRAQLLDITGRLPRIVASVGPVQYAGLGPDQAVAMRNALQLAAAEVAKAIADQLNAKGAR